MGQAMLTAHLTTAAGHLPDFDAGHAAIEAIADSSVFAWPEEELAYEEEFDDGSDTGSALTTDLATLKKYAHRILRELQEGLASTETDTFDMAGYTVYLSGGPSWGDAPTDTFQAIVTAGNLPETVLHATGFVTHTPDQTADTDATQLTDTDVVDMLAVGLGTKNEWSGGDELEWIAQSLGLVRPHPGNVRASHYVGAFSNVTGRDPMASSVLRNYVCDEANDD